MKPPTPRLRGAAALLAAVSVIQSSGTATADSAASDDGGSRPLTGVTLELVGEPDSLRPGERFSVGLSIRHHQGFHSYWKAPGIVGVPWMLDWSLPPGFTAGPIQWPAPEWVKMFQYDAFGYESDTLLVVDITPPPDSAFGSAPAEVTLEARASWMACADTCHPDSAALRLTLPLAPEGVAPTRNSQWAAAFDRARASMPVPLPDSWATWTLADAEGFLVHFTPPDGIALPDAAIVMPEENLIDSAQPQEIGTTPDGRALTVRVNRLPDMTRTPPVLAGLVRLPDRRDHRFASAVSVRPLSASGLAAFRDPIGGWTRATRVASDPQDPRRLAFEAAPAGEAATNGRAAATAHLVSRQEFGDCRVRVEFMIPEGSNSGVYLMGRYEVQILDSNGKPASSLTHGDCGGIYERWDDSRDPMGFDGIAPAFNAALPAGQWQSLDLVFRAPTFGPDRRKSSDAEFVEVVLNGTVLHRNVRIGGPTRAAMFDDEAPAGPLMIQGDHGPVAVRNLVIEPLDLKEPASNAR